MSLLSFRNFAQPILDPRNLVTIILIAALFGAIRLAGGKAGERASPENRRRDQMLMPGNHNKELQHRNETANELDEFDSSALTPAEEIKRLQRQNSQPRADRDLLGDMIGKDPLPPKRAVKLEEPQNNGKPRLDDIAKSLGIK